MLLNEQHSASLAVPIVKTFHDGISVKFEIQKSLGGKQVLTDSAVDCLLTIGVA